MFKLITNVEDQTDGGYTRGWIVPAETPVTADLELEAVELVDIPATENEVEWEQGLRSALADAGYTLDGEVGNDGSWVSVNVTRA